MRVQGRAGQSGVKGTVECHSVAANYKYFHSSHICSRIQASKSVPVTSVFQQTPPKYNIERGAVPIPRSSQSGVMNAISATTILFSAVLLWNSPICNGETDALAGICTPCANRINSPCLGLHQNVAATSCQEIYKGNPNAASGNYWLSNGQCPTVNVTEQYCDMDRSHCGIKGGWLRVAYWNMEDKDTTCPPPLQETNPGKRLCIKPAPTGCTSVVYSTHGVSYNRICGRVRGYQYKSTDAFGTHTGPKNIDSAYTDGVSITYGSPRKHVWTYAAGL